MDVRYALLLPIKEINFVSSIRLYKTNHAFNRFDRREASRNKNTFTSELSTNRSKLQVSMKSDKFVMY